MPQISKRPLKKELENRLYETLWAALAKLDKKESVSEFLEDILTFTERVMIAKRLAIALLLNRGWDQEAISRYLKVSTSTVQHVKTVFRFGGRGLQKVLDQLEQDKAWQEMWLDLKQTLEEILTERMTTGGVRTRIKSEINQEYLTKRLKLKIL